MAKRESRRAGEGMRLVFVGADWRRKGLDRLLRALAIATHRGARISLRVLGCARESLPAALRDVPGVEWAGFVDKRRAGDLFLSLVADADMGCLLSRAEAGGIAYREYHALGLGVIGTAVGGSPEHMIPEGAVMLAADASDDAVADVLVTLARDPERREALRRASWERRHSALYDETARRIGAVMRHGVPTQQGVVQCAG